MHREVLRLIFVFSILSFVQSQATCYWPDGTEAAGYTPCRNNIGACCYNTDAYHDDLCYDNGFCHSWYFGYTYRGACTDQSFNSGSGCAAQCTDFNAGAQAIMSSCAENLNMCCGAAENVTTCCASGGGFQWLNATFINYETQTNDAASSPSAITTTTTTVYMTATAISASTSGATLSSSSTSPKPNCNHQSTALGAGLGVPLGLMTGLALVLGICLLRRNRAIKHGDRNQGAGGDTGPMRWEPRSKPELEATPGARIAPVSELSELR